MARVFVAMSGGVDSSVAAALLLEAGHDVTGITMQLLPEGDAPGECCGSDAVLSARRVAGVLGIPHYTWDLREVFEREVVADFAREYASGRTPNPCIRCNDLIKFGALLDRATSAGADLLATGHYARVVCDHSGALWLARGVDRAKDQSYFLYRLTPDQLRRVVFPLG
ncbi:MAG: tRNA 2-thiouridine(34) synthase MnmA, partial [Coriobacteriia bacterium]|nr:tRNA 2-thiouridine(34) synthase MnmA [Coriobacteriia bacterium]